MQIDDVARTDVLDNVPGARARAERGELAFGTIDCFLLWRLTGGRVHATDATNAPRTLLYDIRKGRWDPELMELLGVPESLLPEVLDSAADFGTTDLLGGQTPILGVAGDVRAKEFIAKLEKRLGSWKKNGAKESWPRNPVPVRARRVLLVNPTYRHHWAIPGGYSAQHEYPHPAAERELREELGIAAPCVNRKRHGRDVAVHARRIGEPARSHGAGLLAHPRIVAVARQRGKHGLSQQALLLALARRIRGARRTARRP